MQGLKALNEQRGRVPHDVIHPVPFELPALAKGQALVGVLASPINPSDVLMLTGGYGKVSGEPCVVSPPSFVFNDDTRRGFWLAKWFRTASRDVQRLLYGELTQLLAGEREGKILVVTVA